MEKLKENKGHLNFERFCIFLKKINYLENEFKRQNMQLKKHILEIPLLELDELDNGTIQNIIMQSSNNNEGYDYIKKYFFNDKDSFDLNFLFELYKGVNSKLEKGYKGGYSFSEFHNLFKILNYILINFNMEILQINLERIMEENINLYMLDDTSFNNCYKDEINKYFSEKKTYEEYEELNILTYKNLLYLFYILTMGGKLIFNAQNNKIGLENYILNLNYFNKFLISHFNYYLLVHFLMIILCYLSIKEENNNSNINSLFKLGKKKSNLIFEKYIPPTIYHIDEISNKELNDEVINLIIIQINCKHFLFNFFANCCDNLNIAEMKINFKILNAESFYSIMFYYEYKNTNQNLNIGDSLMININDLQFLNKKFISVDEFYHSPTYNVNREISLFEMRNFFNKFEFIIQKSGIFIIKTQYGVQNDFLTIENLKSEMEIIIELINFIQKIYKIRKKKKEDFTYVVNFNFFYVYLKKEFTNSTKKGENVIRLINLGFDFSNLIEKDFLNLICQISGFSKFYQILKNLIKNLQKFKKHKFYLTLSNKIFENEEINFLINILALSIQNLLQEKGMEKFYFFNELNKNISNKHTLMVNNIYKEKKKKSIFNKFLKNLLNPGMQIFYKFADRILLYFQEIIIHDIIDNNLNFKCNSLLRNFNNNKLIVRNLINNSLSIDIYIYDKLFYEKIVEFIKFIKTDTHLSQLIKEIKVIVNKQFFEKIINKEYLNTEMYNNLYSLVDIFYIVCMNNDISEKDSNHDNDYDILVLDKRICIISHKPLTEISKNKLTNEHNREFNLKKIIYEFFKILISDFSSAHVENLNTLSILFNTKEKYFANINFVYKSHFNSSIRVLDISDNHMSINKVFLAKNVNASVISGNVDLIKKYNLFPKFTFSYSNNSEINSFDKFNISSLTLILQNFVKNLKFVNKMIVSIPINSKSLSYNIQTEIEKVNLFINHFLNFLCANLFHKVYNNLLIVCYSFKTFLNFSKIFKNFSKFGKLFFKIHIIPLNEKLNLNMFVKELEDYYCYNNIMNFATSNNVSIYQSNLENPYELLYKGFPFQNNKITTTIKMIESTYEKLDTKKLTEYENLSLCYPYRISNQIFAFIYCIYSNCVLNKILNNKKTIKSIISYIGGHVKIELFSNSIYSSTVIPSSSATSSVMDEIINEIISNKGNKLNKNKIIELNLLEKIGDCNNINNSKKKCLIY